jgi:hypothetical protein
MMLQPRRRRGQFDAAQGPYIDEVSPDTFAHTGDPFTVTGQRFGATQGGSTVKIADSVNLGAAGIVRDCGIVNWADDELWAYMPSLTGLPSTSYLFVVTAAGTSNAYPVTIE